jgi:SAM-dependent methyltransferase
MLSLLLLIAVAYLLNKLRRYKRKIIMYRTHETFQPGIIKAVTAEEFDPRFKTRATGPLPASEIRFIAQYKVQGGIDDFESWFICNLAKTANRIFEFGTCTGKTAFLMAANAPKDAKVTTLTLSPEQLARYRKEERDEKTDTSSALIESEFSEFFYASTPEEKKIEQLLGDSKEFDEAPYAGNCDLIFVDGSHARSYVESDSKKALRMVKPGGVILWHDYRGPLRTQGVFFTLNELSKELPLVHIKGTCLVAYRHPL